MGRPGIIENEAQTLDDEELLGKIFRALGDPRRIRILELLLEQERTQKEIVLDLAASQSRVSEHMACLVWCGFVEAHRSGREVSYRLLDPRVGDVLRWAESFLEENSAGISSCRRVR